jgi:hypothetical protein
MNRDKALQILKRSQIDPDDCIGAMREKTKVINGTEYTLTFGDRCAIVDDGDHVVEFAVDSCTGHGNLFVEQ